MQYKNLDRLSNNKSLQTLTLNSLEMLSDISSISNISNMKKLTLNVGNEILTDISVIESLTNITSLTLGNLSSVNTFTPICSLSNLSELSVYSSNALTDLRFVSDIAGNLNYLDISYNNNLKDGTPLLIFEGREDFKLSIEGTNLYTAEDEGCYLIKNTTIGKVNLDIYSKLLETKASEDVIIEESGQNGTYNVTIAGVINNLEHLVTAGTNVYDYGLLWNIGAENNSVTYDLNSGINEICTLTIPATNGEINYCIENVPSNTDIYYNIFLKLDNGDIIYGATNNVKTP